MYPPLPTAPPICFIVVIHDSAPASHGIELTSSGESDSRPSLTVPENLLPHVTFKLRSTTSWKATDLEDNEITEAETEPPCIASLKGELSRTRIADDDKAVGALGFYVPLSNRCLRRG